jgi:3-dehydroquinate dehydratase-2
MRFIVINGPNLNLLGTREPDVYGSETLTELEGHWRRHGARIGVGIDTFQSNHEGEIIDQIQAAGPRHDGIIINAGAYTHYSYAIHDALLVVAKPTIEVHISNIHQREGWRRKSVLAPVTTRVIFGRGSGGYIDAINLLAARLAVPPVEIRYGSEPDQTIDVRVPASSSGVVALIHGGFWREIWASDIMEPLAAELATRGWTTANIEYRRGPDSFEASNEDIGEALNSLEPYLADIGLANRKPTLVGHSAGGYLAIRAARSDGHAKAAIALGPIIDIRGISSSRQDDDPISDYLGGSSDELPEIWRRAELTHSGDESAESPVHIIHGSLDDAVPIEQSRSFADATGGVALVELEGVDHMGVIDPYRDAVDALEEALVAVQGS